MTVLRRLDAVLEDTKVAVLETKASLDAVGVVEQDPSLREAAGQAFYNTSKFTMRGPEGTRPPSAAHGGLRRLPGRVLPQCPRHPRQLRVSQPNSAPLEG